jgi:pyruvate dehydrogenase E2 component (dihydrolipoamide acetyltransferase)
MSGAVVFELVMPSSGMAMTEGAIVEWRVAVGDSVSVGQVVVEIETDKTNVDIETEQSGVVARLLYQPGDVVPVGEPIALIDVDGSGSEPLVDAYVTPVLPISENAQAENAAISDTPASERQGPLGPLARQRFRKAIAEVVTQSWATVPHFSVSREIPARGLLEILAQERLTTPGATLTDVLIAAVVQAADAIPELRADNVGLAVDSPLGVGVAVLTGLEGATISSITAKRASAVNRIKEGRFGPDDLNVTPDLTLSNMGSLGVDSFTGIIPEGQRMLVAVGVARERQSTLDGVSGPSFIATATADHRVLDGADVARFLKALSSASA